MEIVFKVHDKLVDVFYEHSWSVIPVMLMHLMVIIYTARAMMTGAVSVNSVVGAGFVLVAIVSTLFIMDAQADAREERIANNW